MGTTRRLGALLLTLACAVPLAGCDDAVVAHGDAVQAHQPDLPRWATGDSPRAEAGFIRYVMGGRVTGIVDVTGRFPDPTAVGAFVLVDERVGRELPRDDFRHRPVVAVYRSESAAERAAGRLGRDAAVGGNRVVYLPNGFPRRLGQDYLASVRAGVD